MGSLLSQPTPEEQAALDDLNDKLARAWARAIEVKLTIRHARIYANQQNERRRAVSPIIPEGLIAAERVLRQHIGTLDCMVSFEQKALLQYLPTRDGGGEDSEYRTGFRPLNKRFLDDQRIQNFIRRFLCHDGDGIRGCWGDRKLEFVNSVEGWSVVELMEKVKMYETEWKKEGDDMVAFYRKIPGAIL